MTTITYAYVKVDSNTVIVTKTVTDVNVTVTTYTRADVLSQKTAIQDQKARQNAVRNAEIAELDAIIQAAQ